MTKQKNKVFKTILIIFTLFTLTLNAQVKTPYQKKVDQLHTEYFRALHIDESLITIAKNSNDWSIITKSQEFSYAVHSLNKTVILTMTLGLDAKIKDAEKLKNTTDFKNDAIKKEKYEKEKKIADDLIAENKRLELLEKQNRQEEEIKEEKLKKEREEIENKKREIENEIERKKNELEYQEELKIRKYVKSDYGKLKESVKNEFNKLLIKKEFESTLEYENRIKLNQEIELQKIVEKEKKESIENKQNVYLTFLDKYDADKEAFNLNLFNDNKENAYSQTYSINIPRIIAEELKNKFGSLKNYRDGSIKMTVHVLEFNIIDNNWMPSKLLFIFSDHIGMSLYDYNKKIKVMFDEKGNYYLANISDLKPSKDSKLKNLKTQFEKSKIEDGVFFYEWESNEQKNKFPEITIENLNVKSIIN